MSNILVVDDEQSICWGLRQLGESLGHEVHTAASAEEALLLVERVRPDAIVLDVRLPGMDGLTAIDQFRARIGRTPIIVMTAYGDLQTAVSAVRHGAFEYIVKPFDLEQVQRALLRALASYSAENPSDPHVELVGGLVGKSPAMQQVFKQIALAADSGAGVLLSGESGTGKELAARAIHQNSQRASGPFVAVNVASLSPSLAESELFGHAQGAFTGANQNRSGLLAQANQGTLFLDEVADIPLSVQVKLLRALEHGEVVPVGGTKSVETDFRVVSATHQDLQSRIKAGEFRHDLYFRLGAFQIEMPPLRSRAEDIQDLAEHFLGEFARKSGRASLLSEATRKELSRRPWYGNVRELRNAMEHATIVGRGGAIDPDHLPAPASGEELGDEPRSLDDSISEMISRWFESQAADASEVDDIYEQLLRIVEPPLLRAAIEKHRGQCSSAARQLGLHRTTLRKKLDQYDIGGDSDPSDSP